MISIIIDFKNSPPGLGSCRGQLFRLSQGWHDRLFTPEMFPGRQCNGGVAAMRSERRGDINAINIKIRYGGGKIIRYQFSEFGRRAP